MENQIEKAVESAIWIRKTKAGDNYLGGTITRSNGEKINFVSFKNRFKDSESKPDFRFKDENAPAVTKPTPQNGGKSSEVNINDLNF